MGYDSLEEIRQQKYAWTGYYEIHLFNTAV